jgi:hypothetical protein
VFWGRGYTDTLLLPNICAKSYSPEDKDHVPPNSGTLYALRCKCVILNTVISVLFLFIISRVAVTVAVHRSVY